MSSDAITHTILVAAYASAAEAFDGVLVARDDLGAARVVWHCAPNRGRTLRGHDVGLAAAVVVNLFPRAALVVHKSIELDETQLLSAVERAEYERATWHVNETGRATERSTR